MLTPSERVEKIIDKELPFHETLDNYTPNTEKQKRAKMNIEGLLRLIDETNANPPKPIVFMMHSLPGRGKSHLLKAFLNELAKREISYDFQANPGVMGFTGKQKIQAIDDLYAGVQSLETLHQYDFERIEKLIFDVYDNKKILMLTSNFSLQEIVAFIKRFDKIGRLTSRIEEFIGICPDLELDGEDYRQTIASESVNQFSQYFS